MYKILIVEDVEAVADLQLLKLIRAGVAVETRRVDTPQDFTRQLELYVPDVILCSVSVPQFSGLTALSIAQSLSPDTPFIFVFKTADEDAAVECFGPQLFQSTNGKLYLVHPPGKHLEGVASWGDRSPSEQAFTVQDCWALRQTQAHWVGDPRTELLCGHVTSDSKSVPPYLCVPIFAQGETLGLLHLRRVKEESTSPENADSIEPYLNLATAVAEETGLALANLRVRDTLHEQSIRDPLTGWYNRRFLEEFLLRELARADRKKHALSIITLDIDHFKRINDSLGHGAGDIVLRRVGLLLQGYVRESDIACRVGGEEFSLLLPE